MKVYKWLWWYKYLEWGMQKTRYGWYILVLFGVTSRDQLTTLALGIFGGITSVLVGWLWVKFKFMDMENEINNIVNPFQREVRRKLGKKS